MSSEEYAAVALSRVPAIGPKLFRALVAHFDSPVGVLEASVKELVGVAGIAHRTAIKFKSSDHLREADRICAYNADKQISTLFLGTEDYPPRLANYDVAPPVLYYHGRADLSERRSVAIVGTRKMTASGREQVERLVTGLKPYNCTIVSGLAHGVDTAAHRAALQIGLPTVAVMGSGFQHIYPHVNRTTARRMVEQGGGLLTEYPPWQTPEREHFPARNRIVAMVTAMTVVVESGASGGSIITANMAHSYGRPVGACPGRGGDPATEGCNQLIKTGKAHLIESVDDMAELLKWQTERVRQAQFELFETLPPDERVVVNTLGKNRELGIDDLRNYLGLPPARLAGTLLTLEMKGVIAALPGHRYRLTLGGRRTAG